MVVAITPIYEWFQQVTSLQLLVLFQLCLSILVGTLTQCVICSHYRSCLLPLLSLCIYHRFPLSSTWLSTLSHPSIFHTAFRPFYPILFTLESLSNHKSTATYAVNTISTCTKSLLLGLHLSVVYPVISASENYSPTLSTMYMNPPIPILRLCPQLILEIPQLLSLHLTVVQSFTIDPLFIPFPRQRPY